MTDYVKIYPPKGNLQEDFTIASYTLGRDLGTQGGGYGAQSAVMSELFEHDSELFGRIDFDSEYGCFFAYTKTQEDADALKEFVDQLVEQRSPGAEPGGIEDSPAFFTTNPEG